MDHLVTDLKYQIHNIIKQVFAEISEHTMKYKQDKNGYNTSLVQYLCSHHDTSSLWAELPKVSAPRNYKQKASFPNCHLPPSYLNNNNDNDDDNDDDDDDDDDEDDYNNNNNNNNNNTPMGINVQA